MAGGEIALLPLFIDFFTSAHKAQFLPKPCIAYNTTNHTVDEATEKHISSKCNFSKMLSFKQKNAFHCFAIINLNCSWALKLFYDLQL